MTTVTGESSKRIACRAKGRMPSRLRFRSRRKLRTKARRIVIASKRARMGQHYGLCQQTIRHDARFYQMRTHKPKRQGRLSFGLLAGLWAPSAQKAER